jgi:NADPH-dependent 2,4-dienoyl-CoA reductase/sulfur reductase-like enzyme
MAREIAVVGAGASGLAAAAVLARGGFSTIVLERASVAGGVLGAEDPIIDGLLAECRVAGVRLRLGCTALRWHGDRLLVASWQGLYSLTLERVVLAGGSRPGTPAEIGLQGTRPAGVFSAPAALSLLRAGVRIGSRPIVLGAGYWAQAVAAELSRIGVRADAIALGARSGGPAALELRGSPRVSELRVGGDARSRGLPCDAVVLAASVRPSRTVAGAVLDDATGASFIDHASATATTSDTVAAARMTALSLLACSV